MKDHVVFLSGGTGTPKLIHGYRAIIPDEKITIIANVADDFDFYGLRVSPDVDTLLYLFSDKLDLKKWWGIKNDTFNVIQGLKELKEDVWFGLGDLDLSLQLFRQEMLSKGYNFKETIEVIRKRLQVSATILPPTDDRITTRVVCDKGDLHFQEYYVKYKTRVEIQRIYFKNVENARLLDEIPEILKNARIIIIGPSNPITSIGPIIKIGNLEKILMDLREKIVAVSPIIGNEPVSGPAKQLMEAAGYPCNNESIIKIYEKIASTIVIDKRDENNLRNYLNNNKIESKIIFADTLMSNRETAIALSRKIEAIHDERN